LAVTQVTAPPLGEAGQSLVVTHDVEQNSSPVVAPAATVVFALIQAVPASQLDVQRV
jgi:hypothetical protein